MNGIPSLFVSIDARRQMWLRISGGEGGQACARSGDPPPTVSVSYSRNVSFQPQPRLYRFCNCRLLLPKTFPSVANQLYKRMLHYPVASLSFKRMSNILALAAVFFSV